MKKELMENVVNDYGEERKSDSLKKDKLEEKFMMT